MSDRRDRLYNAKLAEQAERYDEMVQYMNEVAKMDIELETAERNLLSVAYKNVIGARRASWRTLSSIETNLEQPENNDVNKDKKLPALKKYKAEVEAELSEKSNDILKVLKDHLIPNATDHEAKVFYHKMVGDYNRYLAEFQSGSARQEAAANSLAAYKAASELAVAELSPTHPIRLGLALNFSVFYYEILNDPTLACKLAKAAFDEAIAELDTLSEESYKDSTLIMQLLRDNLTLWTSDIKPEQESEERKNEGELQDCENEPVP